MKHINKKVIILQTLGSIGAFSIGVILFSSFIGWCGYWFFDACKYDLISIVNLGSKYTLFIVLCLLFVSGIIYIVFKFWEFWIKPFVDLMICRWRKVESKKVAELENDIYKDCIKAPPETPHLKAGIYKKTVNIPTELSFPLPFGKPITRKAAIKVAKQIQRKAERKRKA